MKVNISEISLIELKALAYDQIVCLESCKNNIKLINDEFSRRELLNNPTNAEQKIEPAGLFKSL